MIEAYFVIHNDDPTYNYYKEIEEIKNIIPDKIFCVAPGETEGLKMFKFFLQNINNWLIENNKVVTVLVACTDGKSNSNNVILSPTNGILKLNSSFSKHLTQQNVKFNINDCDKSFTCYNNIARYHRYIMVENLFKHNLVSNGYVTFNRPRIEEQTELKLEYYNFVPLKDEPDFVLNAPNRPEYNAHAIPKSYLKGWVDIVTETNYEPLHFYCSEKTTKPIATLKPFLCLSCANYHKYLQEFYGLQPYTEIFDYSFDSKEDLKERVHGIIENIKHITSLFNKKNLFKLVHNSLMPKLLYNKKQLENIIYSKEKMTPPSLNFLFENTPYKLYGDLKEVEIVQHAYEMKWI